MAEVITKISVRQDILTADLLTLAGIEPEVGGITAVVARGENIEVWHTAETEATVVAPGTFGGISGAWPIGSIFFSALSTDPATLLGFGTWSAIGAGKMLLGVDGTHSLGSTGGSNTPSGTVSTPTFTGDALSSHTHTFTGNAVSSDAVSAGTPAGSVSAPTFTGTSSQATSAITAGTPAGTNSAPTFTGSALGTHSHELPFQVPTTTTTRQIAVATFGTGTSRAATAVSATGTANTTSAAVALTQAVTAGTPAGTVTAPTFTGSALGTHSHTLTPGGTNSTPAFTGSALGTHQHSTTSTGANSSVSGGTPSGSISTPTFTGIPNLPPYLAVNIWQRTA